jgi:RNA polymerase sigma factor (sigma-70 family)
MSNCLKSACAMGAHLGFSMTATRSLCSRSLCVPQAGQSLPLTSPLRCSRLHSPRSGPSAPSAGAWLFGIARHELAQSWRRGRVEAQARRRLGMEAIVLSEDDLERVEELARTARLDSLSLLEVLPMEQREAVRGRVIEERDYDELAEAMGCSEMVVRQRVSRGLRALRSLAGYAR